MQRDELWAMQDPLKQEYRHDPSGALSTLSTQGTLGAVATSLEIPVRLGQVRVEGDLDFRSTLGVSKEAPVGFTAIRVNFGLDSDATDEQLDTLIRLTERYGVVPQTRVRPPSLSFARATA